MRSNFLREQRAFLYNKRLYDPAEENGDKEKNLDEKSIDIQPPTWVDRDKPENIVKELQ